MIYEAIACPLDFLYKAAPVALQLGLQVPEVLIHHAHPPGVMPAKPFFQQLALMHHLASPSRQVHQEGVLAIGQHERAIGQEHPVMLQINHEVAESQEEEGRHAVHHHTWTPRYSGNVTGR